MRQNSTLETYNGADVKGFHAHWGGQEGDDTQTFEQMAQAQIVHVWLAEYAAEFAAQTSDR